jgi:threonine aldolase
MPDVIDLRSDTVTKPSPEMRRAMAQAELGDDVYGEDPTLNALEERAAEVLGKEAGLFVTSGTQGNLVAQLAHLRRGDETIAGENTHIVVDEAGGHAALVRTTVNPIPEEPDGTLRLDRIRDAFQDGDFHSPLSGMVALENTHALSMGQPLDLAYTRQVADLAHEHGIPLHIDGARFFNAAVAFGERPRDLAAPADSLTFCLSKGLACPIGSVVVGSKDFIFRARRARKMVGGGMRQVGVIAAAGLVALQDGDTGMIERLEEDHRNARRLADAIAAMPGVVSPGHLAQPGDGPFDPARVRTNFVLFRVERDRAEFIEAVARLGVILIGYPRGQVRATTHYGVTEADIDVAIDAISAALRETSYRPASVTGSHTAAPSAPFGTGPGEGGNARATTDPQQDRPRVAVAR